MKKSIVSLLLFLFLVGNSFAADQYPVKETLEPFVTNGDLAGIVTVIADKDKILQADTFGYANIEEKVPMSLDSVFWIASQSKPITATAVMILVDEGKLSLDEPVTTYLPELKELKVIAEQDENHTLLVPVSKPITLRHLLSHTSGMIWITDLQRKHKIDVLPFQKVLSVCVNTPLKTQPGDASSYSNMGVNVAATIVERVSKMSFEDFLAKRIFEPLGMKETSFWLTPEQIKRLALVYKLGDDKKTLVPTPNGQLTEPFDNRAIRYPEAAGGLFSTPNDLVKFYQMLQGEGEYHGVRILKPESVRELWTKQTGGLPQQYGLCTAIMGDAFGHGGACGTDSRVDKKTGLVLLYFVQQQLPKAENAKNAFFNITKNLASEVGTAAPPAK